MTERTPDWPTVGPKLLEALKAYHELIQQEVPFFTGRGAAAIKAAYEAIALAEALPQGGWRPIETAPKDGTPLMLFARAKTATAPIRVVGWYLEAHGWIEASFTHPVGIVPFLWQPLPDFPRGAITATVLSQE